VKNLYKTIEEYPRYEINNVGHIRNTKTKVTKFVSINAQGYYSVTFKKGGKPNVVKVHRLIAKYFLPTPSEELQAHCKVNYPFVVCVNHIDHIKLNNDVNNLEWCTHAHNTKESWRVGNTKPLIGEKNGRAILSEEKVHEICKSFEDGMTPKIAVIVYGISRSQATKIRAGHAWTHVSSLYNIKVNKRKPKL
jgi:hypothetical protein